MDAPRRRGVARGLWAGECLLARAAVPPPASQVDPYVARPRVIVLTDIANEPDDQMSLVRFLVYSNQFDVEGLVATTSTWMKDKVRPDVILTVLDAYEQVQPNLLKHAPGFPAAAALRGVVASGQPGYGMAAVGRGKTSPGAELIVNGRARETIRVRSGSSPGEAPTRWPRPSCTRGPRGRHGSSRPSSRSCASTRSPTRTTPAPGSAASSRPCTTSPCPPRRTARSTTSRPGRASAATASTSNAPGADFTTFTDEWVNENVRSKGPLGKHYPFPCCIHEGDTPSFLGLIDNGLASAMSPAYRRLGRPVRLAATLRRDAPVLDAGGRLLPGRDSSRDTVTGRRQGLHVRPGHDLAVAAGVPERLRGAHGLDDQGRGRGEPQPPGRGERRRGQGAPACSTPRSARR